MPLSRFTGFMAVLFASGLLFSGSGCQKSQLEQMDEPNIDDQRDPGAVPQQSPATDADPSLPPAPAPAPSPSPVPPAAHTGCISEDPHHLCLSLKLYAYQDTAQPPVLSEAGAQSLVRDINDLWAPCDIAFQLDHYEAVSPLLAGLHYGNEAQRERNDVRQLFGDDNSFLVVVTGPWHGSTVAWTTMPGTGPFGSILEKSAGRDPVSVAHELGHYQGLYNSRHPSNLMHSRLNPASRELTQEQCDQARANDLRYWPQVLRR